MNHRRLLFLASLTLTTFLSACSDEASQDAHFSNEGLVPEAYLPSDLGIVVSYSTRDEQQFAALSAMEAALGDENRVSKTASQSFENELGDIGLDFERDLQPAFGEKFRIVYGLRPSAVQEEPENFAVITLEDPAKMTEVLETLAEAEQLSTKQLSEVTAYTKDEELFLTVHEDLLFVASTGENLLAMTEQEEDSSLWENELYQDTLEDVGADYMLFGVMYPSLYTGDLALPAGFSVSDIPSVVDKQVVVVRAEEKGLRFDAWVNANKDGAKEAGIAFDSVPRSEPYLFEEIPAEGLMAYFESYGLAQTFTQAEALGDDTASLDQLKEVTRNYFGMDFEELMSFMDKGYSISLHQNGSSIVPGITLYVDSSSNASKAEDFVNKFDGQITGLLVLAEQVLPGAVTKDTVNWGGATFSRLKVDLSSLAQTEGSPLPASLTAEPIELVYGVTGDRLVVSTANSWDSEATMLSESTLYQDLSAQSGEESEGLILIDTQALSDYIAVLESLSGGSVMTEESTASIQNFFEGFLGAIAQSQTEKYESHFGGFLMLAN